MHWVVMFFTGLAAVVGPLVAKVLVGLGVGVATYTGVTLLLGQVEGIMLDALEGEGDLWAVLMGVLAVLNVDRAASLVLSAVAVKYTLMGVAGGTMRRWSMSGGS